VLPRFEVLADKPQHHRVNRNKPNLIALALDAGNKGTDSSTPCEMLFIS